MEIELERKQIAKLPRFVIGKEVWSEIGEELSDNVIVNIQDGKKGDSGDIKQNAESTQKQKRRDSKRLWRGRPAPLIDRQHRFIKQGQGGSWRYWAYVDRVRLEPANQMIRNLNKWVQEKGYVGFWNLTKTTKQRIKRIVKDELLRIIKNTRAKRTK